VDVGVMAEQAVDRFASVAEARRLRLSIKLDGDTHVIAAPPDWLDHLVGVLLDNACKYSPEGGSVDVRVAADGDRVRLTVDDSGPGIPVDQRRRIFERFQRATDQGNGAGLGLAIADAVVRATRALRCRRRSSLRSPIWPAVVLAFSACRPMAPATAPLPQRPAPAIGSSQPGVWSGLPTQAAPRPGPPALETGASSSHWPYVS